MGTTANINVKVGDVYHSATVNHDGYPEYVGELLFKFYNTQDTALMLVSNGDFSSLEENIADIEYYSEIESESNVRISNVPEQDESYSYTWYGSSWYLTGHEYDENDFVTEWIDADLSCVLGYEDFENGNDTSEDETTKVFKYFGTNIDEVVQIFNDWDVTFNTPDERFTDVYNDRNRWMVRHRNAPYQGMDSEGIWHHSFFGRSLYEAVERANEYLKRGKEFEDFRRGV